MNPEGTKRNLKASQPGNYNAEKTGLHSERRRAEKARKVQKAIDQDPKEFCARDRNAVLAREIAMCEFLEKDIAENGVSDRKGNLRRSVGAYARALQRRRDLTQELEVDLAASAAEAKHAEPWAREEGARLLRNIAHNYVSAPASSIKAIELLSEQTNEQTSEPERQRRADFDEIDKMTHEELERDLIALMKPVLTGGLYGPEYDPCEMIRSLAEQENIERQELQDLLGVVVDKVQFFWHHPIETIRRLASQEEIEIDDLRGLCLDLMWEFPLGISTPSESPEA